MSAAAGRGDLGDFLQDLVALRIDRPQPFAGHQGTDLAGFTVGVFDAVDLRRLESQAAELSTFARRDFKLDAPLRGLLDDLVGGHVLTAHLCNVVHGQRAAVLPFPCRLVLRPGRFGGAARAGRLLALSIGGQAQRDGHGRDQDHPRSLGNQTHDRTPEEISPHLHFPRTLRIIRRHHRAGRKGCQWGPRCKLDFARLSCLLGGEIGRSHARSRAFPPEAVLGPCFSTGLRDRPPLIFTLFPPARRLRRRAGGNDRLGTSGTRRKRRA